MTLLLKQAQALYRRVGQHVAQSKLGRLQDTASIAHEKIGTGYGGWFVPRGFLGPESLCYGVGAGEDISFEVELINRYGCEVHCFDPTPRAQRHAELLIKNTAYGRSTSINDAIDRHYRIDRERLARLHFHAIGLWSEDRAMRFYAPENPTHVSHSIVNLQRTSEYFEADCRTLQTIMRMLGHTNLPLLKLDVEGAEYEILGAILSGDIRPSVLCVEFDEGYRPLDEDYLSRIQAMVARVKAAGYRLTYIDGWNTTFIHHRASAGNAGNL